MLSRFLNSLEANQTALRVVGLVNAESGNIGMGSMPLHYCESCEGHSLESLQFHCDECGRSPSNYLFSGSGDGDGIYAVWELVTNGNVGGFLIVYDSGYASANYIRNAIGRSVLPGFPNELLEDISSADVAILGHLEAGDYIEISDVYGGSSNAHLRVQGLLGGHYTAYGFLETPSSYTGPLQPRSFVTVRAVAMLSAGASELLSLDEQLEVDWGEQLHLAMTGMVSSHKVPMGESVMEVNSEIEALRGATTIQKNRQARFCSYCGNALPEQARFCPQCGGATSG